MEDAVVIGVVIVFVEAVKLICARFKVSEDWQKRVIVPACVLVLAAALNVLAAWVWAPEQYWREALRQGVVLGVGASGLYSLAKAMLGKS